MGSNKNSRLLVLIAATMMPHIMLIPAASAQAHPPSGCDICASTGQCDRAYKNSPGQYCGSFVDVIANSNRPCCCPIGTYCKVSQFECRCHVPPHPPAPHHDGHGAMPVPYGGGGEDPYWFVRLIGFLLLLCFCCCCIPACFNRKHDGGKQQWGGGAREAVPVVAAVPASSYPGNPPPTAPGWTPEADYGSTGHQRGFGGGGGGGGGGGLGPALGGLAIGTVVGNMMGQRRDGYFGVGRGGDDGGYDIAGDTGGGGGGGYDIAGDSGGGGDGGCDIAGDS